MNTSPGAALSLAALLTIGAIAGLVRVEPEVDFVDTVPDHPGLAAYRDMLERLDGIRFVAIYMASADSDGLRATDNFDQLIVEQQSLSDHLYGQFPDAFDHQLSALEGIRAGHYMLEKIATAGNPRAEAYSVPEDPLRYQVVRDQALGDGTLDDVLAQDGSSTLMLLFFATKDNLEARHLTRDVADALAAWDGQLVTEDHQVSGLLYSSQYTDERNGEDLRIWGLVAAGAVGLVLLVVLRRPSNVAIAVLSMALATIWAFGFTGWLGIRVSFLTLFLAPVVMGIGIDGAMHLLHRSEEDDAQAAAKHTSRPVIISSLTTAGGLAVLLLVPNPLFAEIGGVAALGAIMAMLAAFLVALPVRQLLGAPAKPLQAKGIPGAAKPRVAVLLALLACTAIAAASTTQNEIVSGSAENEFPQDDPVIALQHRIESEYGAFQRAYIIVRGDMTDPAALQAMLDAGNQSLQLPLAREASSIVDLLLADEATDQGAADIALAALLGPTPLAPSESARLPQSQGEARAALDQLHRDPLWRTIAPFTITKDYSLAVVAITLTPWESQEELRDLRDALESLAADVDMALPNHDVAAAGAPINRAAVIEQTPINVTIATVGTAIVVTLVLAVAWRHQRGGIKVALGAGMLVLVAAVWLLGAIPALDAFYEATGTANNAALNDMFLLAFAITVAISVDDLVHLASRAWEADAAGHPEPLREAFVHAGRAITGTTATTFAAFAVLAGVYFLQSKNLAILTAFGALTGYVLSVGMAPWLLRNTFKPRAE